MLTWNISLLDFFGSTKPGRTSIQFRISQDVSQLNTGWQWEVVGVNCAQQQGIYLEEALESGEKRV